MQIQPDPFYIPSVSYFEAGNVFTGSYQALNYRISLTEDLLVQIWHTPLCYEKATIEAEFHYPVEKESIQKISQFLQSQV